MMLIGVVVAQIIAFGVVILILRKMMVGNTESAVKRLDESYVDINKKKEELVAKMQQIEQEYEKRRQEANKIVEQMRDAAEKEMTDKKDALMKKAHADAERIVTEAVEMKGKIREELRVEERVKIVDYCQELLDAALKDTVKTEVRKFLVKTFLDELEGTDMSHVPPNVKEVEVVSVDPLSPEDRKKLIDLVKKNLNREMSLKESLDPKILGGLVVKFGSLMLDGSIAAKIREVAVVKKQKIEDRLS